MACAYLFGVPVIEDESCAQKRRTARGDRIETRKDAKVAKTEARQGGRTDRTEARTAPGATVPGAEILAASAGPLAAIAPIITNAINPLAGLFGGQASDPAAPGYVDPMLVAAGFVLVGVGIVYSRS